MIRSFGLRDWGLLKRLAQESVPLNASHILAYPSTPVRGAVLHRVFRVNYPTVIWSAENGTAKSFVQLRLEEEGSQAYVLWIGVQGGGELPAIWQATFDELGIWLGRRGVQNLIVEAREDSHEAAILHEIGFGNYARQEIYKLEPNAGSSETPRLVVTRRPKHDWDIEKLYAHVVPNLLRMIEPYPPQGNSSWVVYRGLDLAAYAAIEEGRGADWLRLLADIDIEIDANQLVQDVLSLHERRDKPLYCRVRHYQLWLGNALRNNNFHCIGSQTVMVRHTVQKIKKPLASLDKVLQSNGATAHTSPFIQKGTLGSSHHRVEVATSQSLAE